MENRSKDSYPRFFNAEALGRSLKEVAVDIVHTAHHKVISRWFHSAQDADLFIWMDANRTIIKQQITFYGQVVEWNVIEGVRTGFMMEEESSSQKSYHGGSEILRFDSKPQMQPIEQACHLLSYIEDLGGAERATLVHNFHNTSTSTTMPAEEFIARFGAFLEPEKMQIAPRGFFRRLVRWFRRFR